MGKLLQTFIIVLVLGVLAVTVTNLIFTIIVKNNQNTSTKSDDNGKSNPSGGSQGNRPTPDKSLNKSKTAGFKEAASQLLRGLDESVDPCTDFYAFTCNNYLKTAEIPEHGTRIGTYDEAQRKVYDEISQILDKLDLSKASYTEKLTHHIYNTCLNNFDHPEADQSKTIYAQIKSDLGDIPMFNSNWQPKTIPEIMTVVGRWEGQLGISTLFSAGVTADDGNSNNYALYMSHPEILIPLDYYLKPQFLSQLDEFRQSILDLFTTFAKNAGITDTNLENDVNDIIAFQVQLAYNFIPNDLLKNFRLQFNNYTVAQFAASYPAIGSNYFTALLSGIKDANSIQTTDFIITQPRYYRALDGILQDAKFNVKTLVNYMVMNYLLASDDFIFGDTRLIVNRIKNMQFQVRKDNYDPRKQRCTSIAKALLPYGPGYIYIKAMSDKERNDIVSDVSTQVKYVIEEFLKNVDSLTWMTKTSKDAVRTKANNLKQNIAFPYWFDFNNPSKIDDYHVNYRGLDTENDYFKLLNKLQTAFQKTENLGLLNKPVDRQNFQDSPATVNAWYAPELNSITVPRASLNEPYYRLDFPQSYNYAGNGGTIGHELTHGFDSDGVQYDGLGNLANCNYKFCSILDDNSTTGFLDMAQCVISQYNEQCCPLKTGNVHCTNGVNTQGENIADIGGQYAAYNAYRRYIKDDRKGVEEDLLPGLEKYTGNQIFWITYGFSWCMKQTQDSLANQMLTNEHAPGSCRVNQVMQDLPEFAKDFGCKPKSPLAPEQRCKVWRSS